MITINYLKIIILLRYKISVYSTLADLRNLCDHNKKREPKRRNRRINKWSKKLLKPFFRLCSTQLLIQ